MIHFQLLQLKRVPVVWSKIYLLVNLFVINQQKTSSSVARVRKIHDKLLNQYHMLIPKSIKSNQKAISALKKAVEKHKPSQTACGETGS